MPYAVRRQASQAGDQPVFCRHHLTCRPEKHSLPVGWGADPSGRVTAAGPGWLVRLLAKPFGRFQSTCDGRSDQWGCAAVRLPCLDSAIRPAGFQAASVGEMTSGFPMPHLDRSNGGSIQSGGFRGTDWIRGVASFHRGHPKSADAAFHCRRWRAFRPPSPRRWLCPDAGLLCELLRQDHDKRHSSRK